MVSLWFVVQYLADGRWSQAVKDLIEAKASGDAEKDEPPKKKATGHNVSDVEGLVGSQKLTHEDNEDPSQSNIQQQETVLKYPALASLCTAHC